MGRTGAMSEGSIRRAGKVHDTRCVHIPNREAGEGEGGQRRAQRDITCCAKRKEFRARGPHRCAEREQDTAEQSRCMTHGEYTYRTDRRVMVRAVRGERSVISSCDKRRTLRARGRHRRIEQAQHAGEQARCTAHHEHIPNREADEGEGGQACAKHDSML